MRREDQGYFTIFLQLYVNIEYSVNDIDWVLRRKLIAIVLYYIVSFSGPFVCSIMF